MVTYKTPLSPLYLLRAGIRVPGADTAAGVHGEADGEPVADLRAALGRAHGLQWPHQGLPRLPQLPCANHVQVNQGKKFAPFFFGSFFIVPHTLENVYCSKKMLEEQCQCLQLPIWVAL